MKQLWGALKQRLYDYEVKLMSRCMEDENVHELEDNFLFLFQALDAVLKFENKKNERGGILAMKFVTAQIHFSRELFVPFVIVVVVVLVVAEAPLRLVVRAGIET